VPFFLQGWTKDRWLDQTHQIRSYLLFKAALLDDSYMGTSLLCLKITTLPTEGLVGFS